MKNNNLFLISMHQYKTFLFVLFFLSTGLSSAQSWNSSGNNYSTGRLGLGTTTPQIDIDISRSHETTSGMQVFNSHPSSRSIAMLGEGMSGRYIYMGYLNSSYTSTHEAFESATGIVFTGAPNGLRMISAAYTSFYVGSYEKENERMRITSNGNVGIGTITPTDKLSVNGNIRAQEIKLEATNWPDYVFEKDYQSMPLEEVEIYIKEKGHLPGFKSAKEYQKEGVDIMEMNQKLLEKMEELTLYLIQKDGEMKELRKMVETLAERKRGKP